MLMFVGFCVCLGLLAGCNPPKNPKEAGAEASYGAALQKCVKDNDTEEKIDLCADDVRKRWRVTETITKDGGP